MVRNFDKFEVGHWYIFTGESYPHDDERQIILEHKPLKCTYANGMNANFDNNFHDAYCDFYMWGGVFDLWIEVEDPNKEYHNLVGKSVYRSRSNIIECVDNPVFVCSQDSGIYLLSNQGKKKEKEVPIDSDGRKLGSVEHAQYVVDTTTCGFGGDICKVCPFESTSKKGDECIKFAKTFLDDHYAKSSEEFKIGDKVKIVGKKSDFIPSMQNYIGKIGHISDYDNQIGHYRVRIDDGEYWFYQPWNLEKVKEGCEGYMVTLPTDGIDKIHISTYVTSDSVINNKQNKLTKPKAYKLSFKKRRRKSIKLKNRRKCYGQNA